MKIAAIVCIRNEAVHIQRCLGDFIAEGIDVVLTDNGSTDESLELAKPFLGGGLLAIESLPWVGHFSLTAQLELKRTVESRLPHDWIIHADADEWLRPPSAETSLASAIEQADRDEFNCINFNEFVFVAPPGADYNVQHYRELMRDYYFFQPRYPRQMRVWKKSARLHFIGADGHQFTGDDVKLCTTDFELRHYIMLSEDHFRAKYVGRVFDPDELSKGWHRSCLSITRDRARVPKHDALRTLPAVDSHAFDMSCPVKQHFWEWPDDLAPTGRSRNVARSNPAPNDSNLGANQQTPRVLAVLGMHRSGTSCLAGILQSAGVPAGRVSEWNTDNMRGQRENPVVWKLNDSVLAENGGAWDDPPAKVHWRDSLAAARDKLLADNIGPSGIWMFKDPRTLLTLPFWQEALPGLRKIGTFRHPLRVAASLYLRNQMPVRKGIQPWIAYNESLLREYEREEFPVLCFDLPRESYLRAAGAAVSTLFKNFIDRSNIRIESGTQFYDQDLVHQDRSDGMNWRFVDVDGDMPTRAMELYRSLCAIGGVTEPDLSQTSVNQSVAEPVIPALHTADLLALENRYEEAMRGYRALLPRSSDRPAIWKRMISLVGQCNDSSRTLEVYAEATADCPTDAALWLDMSRIQWASGDNDGATITCRRAIAAAPSWQNTWYQLGNWLAQRQQWVEAVSCFERAVDIGGSDEIRLQLGNIYFQAGRKADGELQLESVTRSSSDKIAAIAHRKLGDVQLADGRAASATSHYREAVARDPNEALSHTGLARALAATNQRPEAIAALQAVRVRFPHQFPALALLVDLLHQEGQAVAAEEHERILEGANPDLPAAQRILGHRAWRLHQYEKAMGHYQHWSNLAPRAAAPRIEIARCLLKLGCRQEGIDQIKAVLAKEPTNAAARALLSSVQTTK